MASKKLPENLKLTRKTIGLKSEKELQELLQKRLEWAQKNSKMSKNSIILSQEELRLLNRNLGYRMKVQKVLEKILEVNDDLNEAAQTQFEKLQDIIESLGKSAALHQQVSDLLNYQAIEITEIVQKHIAEGKIQKDLVDRKKEILRLYRQEGSTIINTLKTLTSTKEVTEESLQAVKEKIKTLKELNSLLTIGAELDKRRAQGSPGDAVPDELGPSFNKALELAKELGMDIGDEIQTWETLTAKVKDITEDNLTIYREQERLISHQNFMYNKIDDTVESIHNKFNTLKGTLLLIPGIGEKAAADMDIYRDAVTGVVEELGNAIRQGKGIGPALKDSWKNFNVAIEGATMRVSSFRVLMLGLSGAYLAGLVYALKLANDMFDRLAKVTKDISQTTGLSVRQSYELGKASLGALTSSKNYLSNLEDISEVQKGLVGETGRMIPASNETLATLSNMAKMFGISQQEAGQLEARMRQMGADEEMSKKLQFHTAQLAEAEGIAPGIISRDLLKNSNLLAKAFSGYPEKAALATIEIRKLGYGLEDAGRVMDHLFDVESSLTAQMEASVGLNRMVDVSKARQLALNGDLAGMMQEMARQAGTYEEYTRMSVPQRILLAKAMGVEEDVLERSLYIQKFAGKLSKEQMAIVLERKDAFKDLKEIDGDMIKSRVEDIQATEALNAQWDKLKGELAKALLPLFESIAGILVDVVIPAVTIIGKTIRAFLWPVTALFTLFKDGFKGVADSFKDTFGGDGFFGNFAKGIVGIVGLLAALPLTLLVVQGGFKGIVGIFKLLGKGLSGVWSMLGGISSTIKNMDFSSFKNFGTSLKDSIQKAWQGGKDKLMGLFGKGQAVTPPAPPAGGGGGAADSITQTAADTAQSASQQTRNVSSDKGQPEGFLRSLGRGLSALGKSAKTKFTGAAVLAAAGIAIAGPFAAALLVIKDVDPAVIGTFALGIGALGYALKLAGNMRKNAIRAGVTFLLIGVSTIPLAYALTLMKDIKPETIAMLAGTMLVLGGALRIAGDMKKDILKAGGAFFLVGASMLPLAFALQLMKDVKPQTAIMLAGTMLILGKALRLAGDMKKDALKAGGAFIAIGVSAIPLAFALQLMKDAKPEAAIILAGTMLVLGKAMKVAGEMKGDILKAGAAFAALSVGAIGIAFALSLIKDVDPGVMLVFGGVVAGLGFVAGALGKIGLSALMQGVIGLAAIGVALLPFALAFSLLKGFDMGSAKAALVAIAGIVFQVGIIGAAIVATAGIGGGALAAGALALAGIGAAIIPFAAGLQKLQGIDPNAGANFKTVLADIKEGVSGLGKKKTLEAATEGISTLAASSTGIVRMATGLTQANTAIESLAQNLALITPDMFSVIANGINEINKALDGISIVRLAALALLASLSFVTGGSTAASSTVSNLLQGKNLPMPQPSGQSNITEEVGKSVSQLESSQREGKNEKVIEKVSQVVATDMTKGLQVQPNEKSGRVEKVITPQYQVDPYDEQSTKMTATPTPTPAIPTQGREVLTGSKTEILLNRIAIALEQHLKSKPPMYLMFDDGTIKQINTALRRSTS